MRSLKKYQDFCEKSYNGWIEFGEAKRRPQDEFKEFRDFRVELNEGHHDSKWNKKETLEVIELSEYNINLLKKFNPATFPHRIEDDKEWILPRPLFQNECLLVSNDEKFDQMMTHLRTVDEMVVDVEYNDHHSYLGMTCSIQIATTEYDYIINGISLFKRIQDDLSQIFEDAKIVKYFTGIRNDVRNLKRDYFINLVEAVDVQIIFQEFMRDGILGQIVKGLPHRHEWLEKYIDLHGQLGGSITTKELIQKRSQEPLGYEAICKLFYWDVEFNKNGQLADHRPRAGEKYEKLLDYSRTDVHVMLHVLDFVKLRMFQEGISGKYFREALQKTKEILRSPYKRKEYESAEEAQKAKPLSKIHQNSHLKEEWIDLYEFRELLARAFDENPKAILSDGSIIPLITRRKPLDKAMLIDIILSSTVRSLDHFDPWPETLEKSAKYLLAYINGNQDMRDFVRIDLQNLINSHLTTTKLHLINISCVEESMGGWPTEEICGDAGDTLFIDSKSCKAIIGSNGTSTNPGAIPSTSHGLHALDASTNPPPAKKAKITNEHVYSSYDGYEEANAELAKSKKLGSDICCVCIEHKIRTRGQASRHRLTATQMVQHYENRHQKQICLRCQEIFGSRSLLLQHEPNCGGNE